MFEDVGFDLSTDKGRETLVMAMWEPYAAYCYAMYDLFGRGCMLIPVTDPDPDPAWLQAPPGCTHDLAEAIAEYDPETQILVLFWDGTKRVVFDTYSTDDMAPPLAYERIGNTEAPWDLPPEGGPPC